MAERGMGTSCDWLATALATFSDVMNEVAFFFNTLSIIFSISFIKPLMFESRFPPTVVASASGQASKECGADVRPRRISLMRPKALAAAAARKKAWPVGFCCSACLLGAARLSSRVP